MEKARIMTMVLKHGDYTYYWNPDRNKYVEARVVKPKEMPYAVKIRLRSEQESRKWFINLPTA
jgi:hypothetical protein